MPDENASDKTAIHEAISDVLRSHGRAMTPGEIYTEIKAKGLYSFKAIDPAHVVVQTLRRHAHGLDFKSARAIKYYALTADGRYLLLERPVQVKRELFRVTSKSGGDRVVSVPSDDDDAEPVADGPSHSEIQWRLLTLGAELGLSVWAPKGDRSKMWNENAIGDVPGMLRTLPVQFNRQTTKTIENIDVLWIERQPGDSQAILAAFEVEHTSAIYSGLLRMSDLVTMQPNIDIRMYLVAPDNRQAKFKREIARPTFVSRRKPLWALCRFLPYTTLVERLDEVKNVTRHLRPEFLDDFAEAYDPTIR